MTNPFKSIDNSSNTSDIVTNEESKEKSNSSIDGNTTDSQSTVIEKSVFIKMPSVVPFSPIKKEKETQREPFSAIPKGFSKATPKEEQPYTEPASVFARGLPEWNLDPPGEMITRPKVK